MPIDVNQLGCDILCATGRKFLRGPRGTGLLYVRQKILTTLDPPLLNHHAANLLSSRRYQLRPDARRFECWERSCAGQVALGRAIDYAREWGLEAIAARIGTLATSLRTELSQIPGITVTDQGLEKSGIVTFMSDHTTASDLQQQLAKQRINISTVPFNANPLRSEQQRLPELARASVHYYNTDTEIMAFCAIVSELLNDP